jgi:hypothetical protein
MPGKSTTLSAKTPTFPIGNRTHILLRLGVQEHGTSIIKIRPICIQIKIPAIGEDFALEILKKT